MNTLCVKEFDLIKVGCINGVEVSQKHFDVIKRFVLQVSSKESEDSSVPPFFKLTQAGGQEAIKVRNYVGVIELSDGFQIEILPKVHLGATDSQYSDEERTRYVFIKMLRCLGEAHMKVGVSANLKNFEMPLLEVFISMYLNSVMQLTRRGLRSGYQLIQENVYAFKGKLLVAENISRNLTHGERFFVEHDEFQLDRPENRLIKSTLMLLLRISHRDESLSEIRKQLMFFDGVSQSTNIVADFNKVVLDRNTTDYTDLLAWSDVFLRNKSFVTSPGDSSVKAILFPMEKVYETYVARILKKTIAGNEKWKNWTVKTQSKSMYLFDEPQMFKLIPDIIMENGDKKVILDTKWKRLENNATKHYGISQGDMYQMFAYAHKFQTKDVWLLYPKTDEMNQEQKGNLSFVSKYDDDVDGKNVDDLNVRIFFVDLDNDNFDQLAANVLSDKSKDSQV